MLFVHGATLGAGLHDVPGSNWLEAAARVVRAAHDGEPLRLVGGSWGSILAARHGARDPGVGRLVLHAPIWSARDEGWLDLLADPADPSRPARWGPTRPVAEAELRTRGDAEPPRRRLAR